MASFSRRAAARLRRLRRQIPQLTIDPDERALGGRAGGALWLVGGLSFACYPLLLGVARHDLIWIYGIAVVAILWGLLALRIDWRAANPFITHLSTLGALAAIGGGVATTGAASSGAWVYLFWVALFACYFYVRPVAAFYVVACVITQALPLLYDAGARHEAFLSQLIPAGTGYVAIGGCVVAGKQIIERTRLRAEALAAEQGALHRAAAAVLRGEPPEAVFQIVSAELAAVLQGPHAGVFELVANDQARVVGNWSDGTIEPEPAGTLIPVRSDGAFAQALSTGRVVRASWLPPWAPARRLGCQSTIVAPVQVGDEDWGLIALGSREVDGFRSDDEQYLAAFAELVAHIVSSLSDRARLTAQALTDQLTGLANHRALHQRLAAEVHGCERHGRVLSVAMLDVDNFKEINDLGGHASGDAALRAVADCLRVVVRAEDTIGRIGGDEFMWVMPDTDSHEALMAVERARDLIATVDVRPKQPTTSAGVCDTSSTFDPAELVRLTDIALYSSKAAGRNVATIYDASAAVGPNARVEWFERSQALVGLRALARAIDAKDQATRQHSERVADFAGRLARAIGWSTDQVASLREAALVHDVGKLGVPDAILTKPDRLTDAERTVMHQHVEMSARIVGAVLSKEQVSWIRAHHERPDGLGYPTGLRGEEVPEGAALIALADAWDVMIAGRPYSAAKSPEESFAECASLAGAQFSERAVRALDLVRAPHLLLDDEFVAEPELGAPVADALARG